MTEKFFTCGLFVSLLLFPLLLAAESQIDRDKKRGIVFSEKGRILVKFPNTLPDTEYTVPDGVVIIDERAFYYCTKLERVYFPKSLRVIRKYAFSNCRELDSVTFPLNMRHISSGAFLKCDKLKVVRLFSGTWVSKNAFPRSCRISRYQ
jgi:hypothetical protein